jgi:hypothetical protein
MSNHAIACRNHLHPSEYRKSKLLRRPNWYLTRWELSNFVLAYGRAGIVQLGMNKLVYNTTPQQEETGFLLGKMKDATRNYFLSF